MKYDIWICPNRFLNFIISFFVIQFILCNSLIAAKKTTYYPSGKIKDSFEVNEKGQPDGLYRTFYDLEDAEGKQILKGEANFRDGLLESVLQRYYPDGTRQLNAYYKDGKPHGNFILYAPDGTTILEETKYDNGKLISRNSSLPKKKSEDTDKESGSTETATLSNFFDSSNNLYLVASAAENDPLIKIWDVKTEKILYTLSGTASTSVLLEWSPDGKLLAVARADGFIDLWDVKAEKKIIEITRNGSGIPYALHFAKKKKQLFAAVNDSIIRVWDTETGNLLKELPGNHILSSNRSHCMALSEDERFLALTSKIPNRIIIWDTETWQKIYQHDINQSPYWVYFLKDGENIIYEQSGRCFIKNFKTGEERHFPLDYRFGYMVFPMNKTRDLWFSIGMNHGYYIFDLRSEQIIRSWKLTPSWLWFSDISSDKKCLLYNNKMDIEIWDLEKATKVKTLQGHSNKILCSKFCPIINP
ncbi:MAG: hypothetical protein Q4C96_11520 [Planctomycetia bacterium]|nr:hypothetical protein [Planctomycetia bacterium]